MKIGRVIDWLHGGYFDLLDFNMLAEEENGKEDKNDLSTIESKK